MTERIRIAVIDDHPMLREGVIHTLKGQADFDVVAEGQCAADALRIAQNELPDIMLLDVSMPGGGIEAARAITDGCPAVRVAMLTVAEDEETVSTALGAGARGYILKGVSGPDLVKTVRNIHAGEDYVTPGLAAKLLAEMGSKAPSLGAGVGPSAEILASLNPREEGILVLVADGLSNREVGEKLDLSEKTIKHYMTNILQKLHVRNRVEAALLVQKYLAGKVEAD